MKHKILIIEDDPTIQTQLKNLLSYNGYEVEAVTDFSKVMEQLKAFTHYICDKQQHRYGRIEQYPDGRGRIYHKAL